MVIVRCAVRGCNSTYNVPGHVFPKDQNLCKKWRRNINCFDINKLTFAELRRRRVCGLHFADDAYISTLERRKLKHNAVPTLRLSNVESNRSSMEEHIALSSTRTDSISSNVQSTSERIPTYDVASNSATSSKTQQPKSSGHTLSTSLSSNQSCIPYIEKVPSYVCNGTSLKTPEASSSGALSMSEPEQGGIRTCGTPRQSVLMNQDKRTLLGSVTRQTHLTPKASSLNNVATCLKRERYQSQKTIVKYKLCLDITKKRQKRC